MAGQNLADTMPREPPNGRTFSAQSAELGDDGSRITSGLDGQFSQRRPIEAVDTEVSDSQRRHGVVVSESNRECG